VVGRAEGVLCAAAWAPPRSPDAPPAIAVGTDGGEVKFYASDLAAPAAAAAPLRPPERYHGFAVSLVAYLTPAALLVGYRRDGVAGGGDAEVGVCLFDFSAGGGGTVYDMEVGVALWNVPPRHEYGAAFLEPWSLGVLVCNAAYDPQVFVRRRAGWTMWEVEERYKGSLRVPRTCARARAAAARARMGAIGLRVDVDAHTARRAAPRRRWRRCDRAARDPRHCDDAQQRGADRARRHGQRCGRAAGRGRGRGARPAPAPADAPAALLLRRAARISPDRLRPGAADTAADHAGAGARACDD
jgi:hypothetical protein